MEMPTILAARAQHQIVRKRKEAKSNQQDLIGKMQTNRPRKPARRKETLLETDADQQTLVIGQRQEDCWRSLSKRNADHRR